MTKNDKSQFRAFCEYATDSQLRNIYAKEILARRQGYASIAKSVMNQRGLS